MIIPWCGMRWVQSQPQERYGTVGKDCRRRALPVIAGVLIRLNERRHRGCWKTAYLAADWGI